MLTLIHRKGAWLAGCAQQHQRVDLGFQLHEEQTAKRGFVKLSVWQKRRYQRSCAAGKQRHIHQGNPPG